MALIKIKIVGFNHNSLMATSLRKAIAARSWPKHEFKEKISEINWSN